MLTSCNIAFIFSWENQLVLVIMRKIFTNLCLYMWIVKSEGKAICCTGGPEFPVQSLICMFIERYIVILPFNRMLEADRWHRYFATRFRGIVIWIIYTVPNNECFVSTLKLFRHNVVLIFCDQTWVAFT